MQKTFHLVEETEQATHYYVIPQHTCLIPKCSNAQRVLVTLLSEKRDVHSPIVTTEYPVITRRQATLFKWKVLTVKVHYVRTATTAEVKEMGQRIIQAKHQAWIKSLDIDLDAL